MLSRGPSEDRIARSCRHMGSDLTVRIGVRDRIAKLLSSQHVLGVWGRFKPWLYALKSSKNSHRIAKQFLRRYCFLSQRSCRLSRDRRQRSVWQCASNLYGSTCEKVLGLGGTGKFLMVDSLIAPCKWIAMRKSAAADRTLVHAAHAVGVFKGRKKQRTKLFVAENGPFGTPFLTPKIPPKKFFVGPFFAFFPRK